MKQYQRKTNRKPPCIWSEEETATLKRLYSIAQTREELLEAFPGKTWRQISDKAYRQGWKVSNYILKDRQKGGCWNQTPHYRKTPAQHHQDMLKAYGQLCEGCGAWLTHSSYADGHGKCLECLEKEFT